LSAIPNPMTLSHTHTRYLFNLSKNNGETNPLEPYTCSFFPFTRLIVKEINDCIVTDTKG